MNAKSFSIVSLFLLFVYGCEDVPSFERIELSGPPGESFPGSEVWSSEGGLENHLGEDFDPVRFIIGYGSGEEGFQSIEFSSDGNIDLVFRSVSEKVSDDPKYYRVNQMVSKNEISRILNSEMTKMFYSLPKNFESSLSDGSQGFVYLSSLKIGKLIRFNNYFPYQFRDAWLNVRTLIELLPKDKWSSPKEVGGFEVNRGVRRLSENN